MSKFIVDIQANYLSKKKNLHVDIYYWRLTWHGAPQHRVIFCVYLCVQDLKLECTVVYSRSCTVVLYFHIDILITLEGIIAISLDEWLGYTFS